MNGEPTLLVVDDEASNLESLERIFAREGLTVLAAKDGKDALEVVRKRRVDVVLTDLMMPGISRRRSAQGGQAALARDRDGGDDRLRHRRGGGRGDARGRVRLHHQAAQARARGARGVEGAGEAVADGREQDAQGAARGDAAAADRRAVAGDAAHARGGAAGGAVDGDGAAARRVGHGQGAAGAADPRVVAARRARVRPGQLRGDPRGHPGGRAVRLREGRVHRRGGAARRPLRARRRRHPVPRRDRRDSAERAGQALARPAGGRDRAARRQVAEDRHSPGRGDQQGSAQGGRRRHRSARTSTTA